MTKDVTKRVITSYATTNELDVNLYTISSPIEIFFFLQLTVDGQELTTCVFNIFLTMEHSTQPNVWQRVGVPYAQWDDNQNHSVAPKIHEHKLSSYKRKTFPTGKFVFGN